ncbi:MAG: UDP-N-acetylmuramate--L-alanine ligase [Candidatus Dadabacteria bacterium]|nr:UDP-N-acetylmuramate--L-alanine ligase [Candidatus Dadabacteria bacterium]
MYGKISKAHFIGIGGIGMSGIAEVLINMGVKVSGSDLADTQTTRRLASLGAVITTGHNSENIKGSEVVVYSSAISEKNPEMIAAAAARVPLIPRAEMLAELMRLKFGIAVAGSHGKTTTSSMIASVLSHCGADPTIVVGGKLRTIDSNAHLGTGQFMVVEADESDGSFDKLSPVVTVLTNIDREHLDYYGGMDALELAFSGFLHKIPFYGLAVTCADCPRTAKISRKFNKKTLTYGISAPADLMAENIRFGQLGTLFEVIYGGYLLGEVKLQTLGAHNALNSLAAVAVGMEFGYSFEKIKQGLANFEGTERRLQLKSEKKGIMIIDDYGHHPSELEVTIEALRAAFSREPILLFQPHRFSRTKLLYNDFVRVLGKIKHPYILDIYPAGEKPVEGISSEKLVEDIKKAGNTNVRYVDDPDAFVDSMGRELTEGDILLTSGAGNVWKYGDRIAELI